MNTAVPVFRLKIAACTHQLAAIDDVPPSLVPVISLAKGAKRKESRTCAFTPLPPPPPRPAPQTG